MKLSYQMLLTYFLRFNRILRQTAAAAVATAAVAILPGSVVSPSICSSPKNTHMCVFIVFLLRMLLI